MAENKSGTRDSEGDRLWDMLQDSITEMQDDMDRMKDMRKTLDASIDEDRWPTLSKFPLAEAWSTTEAALGPAIEALYPPTKFVTVMPPQTMEDEVRERIEWALYIQMTKRMRLKKETAPSIRDAFGVSVGYGIVEPITVTPNVSYEIVAGPNRTTQMGQGKPVRSIQYRYLSSGRVVPYPEGVDFNGPRATPVSFFLDSYSEYDFRKLYEGGDDSRPMKGDVDEIIEVARSLGFGSSLNLAAFVNVMGGKTTINRHPDKKNVSVSIPVLKCYEQGKHTWLFCGGSRAGHPQVIWQDSSFAATRCPLIKWDPWIDSDRWFPMSQPEADMHNVWAKNVWFNAIFDLLSWSLKPTLVYDNSRLRQPPVPDADGSIGLPGNVRDVADYLKRPGIDQSAAMFGDIIDANHARATGQRDLMERNFTRGGSQAFESLLNSSGGRDRLRYAMLQMGGLESIANQVLTYMQVFGNAMDLKFQMPDYAEGKNIIRQYEITEDDIRHGYKIVLDLDDKYRMGDSDYAQRFALYDREKDNPYVDQFEAVRGLYTNEAERQRKVLSREEVQRKQQERDAAQLEAMRQQGAAGGGAGAVPEIAGRELGGAV